MVEHMLDLHWIDGDAVPVLRDSSLERTAGLGSQDVLTDHRGSIDVDKDMTQGFLDEHGASMRCEAGFGDNLNDLLMDSANSPNAQVVSPLQIDTEITC